MSDESVTVRNPAWAKRLNVSDVSRSLGRWNALAKGRGLSLATLRQAEELLARRERDAARRAAVLAMGVPLPEPLTPAQRKRKAKGRRELMRSWQNTFVAEKIAVREDVKRAVRKIEKREQERRRIEAAMQSAPGASAAHRGTKSTHALDDRTRRERDAPRERLTDGRKHPVTVESRP